MIIERKMDNKELEHYRVPEYYSRGGGGTLYISGWGVAARPLIP